jgi:Raf kinase inhibitor-like YbhB/YbcL family protein
MRLSLLFSSFAASVILSNGACAKPPIEPRFAPGVSQPERITVTAHSFTEGTRIPVDHTCDGSDVMPELVLSSPPEHTKSLLILVEDPDASSGAFTHMIAFNVSPELRRLPSTADLTAAGEAARFGLNDFGGVRYQGPCPPKGEAHRYRFRVIAIDTMLKLTEGASRTKVDEAIDAHILGEGSLTGHFGH